LIWPSKWGASSMFIASSFQIPHWTTMASQRPRSGWGPH
jgi:hypothetical protein